MTGREFSQVLGISHEYLRKLEIGLDPRSNKPINPSVKMFNKIECGITKAQGLGLIFFGEKEKRRLAQVRTDIFKSEGYYDTDVNSEQNTTDLALHYKMFLDGLLLLDLELNGVSLTQEEIREIHKKLRTHFFESVV